MVYTFLLNNPSPEDIYATNFSCFTSVLTDEHPIFGILAKKKPTTQIFPLSSLLNAKKQIVIILIFDQI